jgi:acyl CoA:acetate/3-ketoacid CoA transferase alpha subunit
MMTVCAYVVNLDTLLQTGEIPVRLGPVDKSTGKMTVLEAGKPRETRIFDGKIYGMETAIKADVAILRAWKVDEAGNCQFRYVTHHLSGKSDGWMTLTFQASPPKHSA